MQLQELQEEETEMERLEEAEMKENDESYVFHKMEACLISLKQPDIISKINIAFDSESVIEALKKSTGVTKTALLMIINILVPTMSEEIQTMTSTPLETFGVEGNVLNEVSDPYEVPEELVAYALK